MTDDDFAAELAHLKTLTDTILAAHPPTDLTQAWIDDLDK